MNTIRYCKSLLAMAALGVCASALAAPINRTDYVAGKDRISADYKVDKAACKQSTGNARDICMLQAKGKEAVARAELEVAYTGKPSDAAKVPVVRADADYKVAKERCDDLAGNPKATCVTEAKAVHEKALADAKLSKTVGAAQKDATQDKRDADYSVAKQKCDSLTGDAQSACLVSAKARFDKV
jgi:hypothetical protein